MSLSATSTPPSRPAAPRWRRWLRRSLLGLLLIAGLLAMTLWALLRASLPQLDGRIQLPGLSAALSVARDSLGTAVLQGENRLDLARGLGFVHAQERFFEMDLSRRSAAGELAALFGPKAVERDQERRLHRLRARLSERLAGMSEADRALLQAYASGVNAGLAALRVRPWQYLLLRAEPQDWTPVDSLLVIGEMFTMLQSGGIQGGFERALLREKAGDTLFDWLHPRGGRWDAALDGSQMPPLPLPGPELLNLQKSAHKPEALARATSLDEAPVGSNNWAVAGSRTADGRAILADDMHLSLSVPSIWYRTQLQLGRGEGALRAAGLSLPGVPSLVVGSNGQVAWGFTNAYGQWFDWIALPAEIPAERLRVFNERIEVKGEPARAFRVQEVDGAPSPRPCKASGMPCAGRRTRARPTTWVWISSCRRATWTRCSLWPSAPACRTRTCWWPTAGARSPGPWPAGSGAAPAWVNVMPDSKAWTARPAAGWRRPTTR